MKTRTTRFSNTLLALTGSVFLTTQMAHAATYYWDSNGTSVSPSGLGDTGSLTWGSSLNVATISAAQARGVIGGTFAVANTAVASGDTMYFGTVNMSLGATASTIGTTGTLTLTNLVIGAGQTNNITFSAGGTITLAGTTPTIAVNNASNTTTIAAILAGTVGMTKAGAGTLTLTNASNSLTGGVIIRDGGILNLGNGTSGGFTATTNALTFNNGGGTFNLAQASAGSQTMGALTFSAGDGSVISTAASGVATQTLTFGSFVTRTAGATGNFSLATNTTAADNKIVLTSSTNAPLNGSGSNNQGLFFGGTDYARYDTTAGYFRAVTYGTDFNAAGVVGTGATLGINNAVTDVKISGDITAQDNASVNTLNLAVSNLTFQNTASTLSVNGILSAGSASAFIANGTNASAIQTTASGGELVVRVNGASDALTIAPNIVANGASSLTKSGAGTLTLSGNNTYTGVTTINGGTLALSGSSAIVDTGAVILANAANTNLLLNNSETIGSLSGGGFSGGNVNVGANTLTISGDTNTTFGGKFIGAGAVTKTGAGTLTLSNNNTFAGTLNINAGTVDFAYGNDGVSTVTALSSGGTISMANGTTLGFNPVVNLTAGVIGNALNSGLSWTVSNAITVQAGATASIKFAQNGSKWNLSGGVTGASTGSGNQTLSIVQGYSPGVALGSGDAQNILFSGVIQNGSVGTLGVNVDFSNSSSPTGQSAFVNLSGLNTFTGPLVVTNSRGMTNGGWLTIGGERTNITTGITAGSGYLGGGNYTNTISLGYLTILDYASSANQTLGGIISGTGSLQKDGSGNLTLSAANTFTGSTTVSAGIITITNTLALQNSAYNTTGSNGTTIGLDVTSGLNSGALTLGGLSGSVNLATAFTAGYTGSVTNLILNPQSGSVNYSGVISNGTGAMTLNKTGAGTQILSGTNTYTGATTISGGTLQIGNGSTTGSIANTSGMTNNGALVYNRSDALTVGYAIGGSGTLTKQGAGTTSLTNTNTYNGATTINVGTLALSGANGAIGSSAVTIAGGALTLSNANAANNSDRLSNSLALTLNSGTFNFNNDASANDFSESAGTLTLVGGSNTIAIQQAAVSQTSTLTLAGLSRTAGVINFSGAGLGTTVDTRGKITFTSAPPLTGGILGPWATVNGTSFATLSGNDVVAYAGHTDVTRLASGTKAIADSSSADVRIIEGTGGAANITLANPTTTINTLLHSISGGTSATTVDIASGQILRVSAINAVATSGALTLGTAANTGTLTAATAGGNLLLINSSANTLTVNSVIADFTSASSLTKDGSGIVSLAGANTYTGGLTMNAGTLNLVSAAALGAPSSITFAGNSILNYTVGGTLTFSQLVTINSGVTATIERGGAGAGSTFTFNGGLSGSGTLDFTSGGSGLATYNLNNASAFTGTVQIGTNTSTATTHTISMSSIGDGGKFRYAGTGAVMAFTYTGAATTFNTRQLEMASSQSMTFNNNGTGAVVFNQALSVTASGNKTLTLSGSTAGLDNTFAGLIANGSSATIGLTKAGVSSWILSNTSNSYTGVTTLTAGILEVSKLANGGVNSGIGASSNAASNLSFGGGTLRYVGTGDSTDRSFTQTGAATLDSSGSGAINFTNTVTPNYGTANTARALTLTGTNTGNNTLAAAITNNGTGANTISKTGIGTWVLSGANTNTGATNLSGGGTLVLDYTANNGSKLSDTAALTLNGSGLVLKGGTGIGANHTEVVLSTTLSANTGNSISRNGGTSKISLGTITFGSFSTLAISEADLVTTTTANATGLTNATSILNLGRVTVGSHFGTNNGGNIEAFGDYATATTAGGSTTSTVNQLTGGGTLAANLNSYALRIVNDGNSNILDIDIRSLILVNNGTLLYAGGGDNNYTINGTGFITSASTDQPFVINTYAGTTLTVNARIEGRSSTNGIGIVKAGEGTLVVGGANDFIASGVSYVQQGVLRLANNTGLGLVNAGTIVQGGAALELSQTTAVTPADIAVGAEALTINGNGISNGGALRNYSGNNSWAGAITIGAGGSRINSNATTSLTLSGGVVTSANNHITFGGAGNTTVQTVAISGAGGLIKDGAGMLNLNFANTYTGATTISAGKLILGSSGSLVAGSAVSVVGGALGGTGTVNGSVALTTAGGIDLRDGAIGTLILSSTLGSSGAAGMNHLYFDLGNTTGTSDMLSVAGTTSVATTGAAVINLAQLGGTSGRIATTYTLIGGAGTLAVADFNKFSLATTSAFGQTYALTNTGNDLQVVATNVTSATAVAFWTGGGNNWSTSSNWNTDATSSIGTGAAPDYQTNVTFSTTTPVPGNLTTNVLDVDFDINSLTLTDASDNVTIGGTKMLTIEAAAVNGNAAGNGIDSQKTTGTNTISAKVGLAASQTWTVANGGTLAVSGVISDFGLGNSLTKAGTGTLALTAANTYTGATNVNDGTLFVNGSIASSSLTTVASGATIGGSGTVGALTVSSGGFINTGNGLTTGILNTGNYSQAGLYTVDIGGLTAGTQHDQINVTGAVNIAGGSLTAMFTGSYAVNDLIFILLNDGGDAITGTYAGLAQGATFSSGGYNWSISYTANNTGIGTGTFTGGNDIVLMAIPEPKTALLGFLGVLLLLRRRR